MTKVRHIRLVGAELNLAIMRVTHWCKYGLNPGRYDRGSLNLDARATRKQWVKDQWIAALTREATVTAKEITKEYKGGMRKQELQRLKRQLKNALERSESTP
jgi:hypothetical protein